MEGVHLGLFSLPSSFRTIDASNMTYQSRLARTLHSIQAQEEWPRPFGSDLIFLLVQLQSFEDERYAVLGLVINDYGHGGSYMHQELECTFLTCERHNATAERIAESTRDQHSSHARIPRREDVLYDMV